MSRRIPLYKRVGCEPFFIVYVIKVAVGLPENEKTINFADDYLISP